jgi:phosphatidate phosphatase APP1
MHRAARIEDAVHEFRVRRVRRKGFVPRVLPYTGYGTTTQLRVLARVLYTRPTAEGEEEPRAVEGVRGWRSFTSVFVNNVAVTVTADGQEHRLVADRGGVVDADIPVSLQPGWHTITISTAESEPVQAPVFIVAPDAHIGIVSDVDDTVMVTALPRPFVAAWNTFVLDEHARMPTPGMAVFLDRFSSQHPGSPVVYLSTGAWNVAPALTRFLSRNLYPKGALLLTDWGPTHDRFFRSGREHKEENLRRLVTEFPDVRWLLVGDDGQHDEAIYGEFAAEYPQNVAAIAIRQLSAGEAVLAGGRSKAAESSRTSGTPWVYAPDGAGLSEQLGELGIL